MTKKILVFLGEEFIEHNNTFFSTQTPANFIKYAFEGWKITFVSPSRKCKDPPKGWNVKLRKNEFESIGRFSSIVEFASNNLSSPRSYKNNQDLWNKIITKVKPDIVWVRNPSLPCLMFSQFCISKNPNIPIINHMCANSFDAWRNPKYGITMSILGFFISRVMLRLCSKIVRNPRTYNLCTGSELEQLCLKKSNSVSQFIDITLTTSKKIIRNSKKMKKIIFVGRMQQDKGILDLIESVQSIKSEGYQIELDIIGDGDLNDVVQDKSKKIKEINYLGRIPNNEIPIHLQKSDLLVVPSINLYEGFPRVILEAWNCGLPVLVSDVGGVKGLVKHLENGYIYDPFKPNMLKKSLIETIRKPEVYEALSKGAIRMSKISNRNYWMKVVQDAVKQIS